ACDDREVERAVQQRANRIRRRLRDDADVDAGPFLSKCGDDARQPVVAGVALGREPHDASSAASRLGLQVALEGLDLVQDTARGREDSFACRRQDHAATCTNEEGGTDAAFELAQLVAESGLRKVKSPSRAGLTARLGNRGDESEVPEIEVEWASSIVVGSHETPSRSECQECGKLLVEWQRG